MTTEDFTPGTVVAGPFVTANGGYNDYQYGVGVVQPRSKSYPFNCGTNYVPIKIIQGDRCDGGYNPESLISLPALKEV